MQVVTKTKIHSEKTYRNISYNSIQCQDNHEKHDINKRKVKKKDKNSIKNTHKLLFPKLL